VELIHGSPPTWNINKVQTLFLPYDAEAILKIPLSGRAQDDKIFWFDTRDGKYSVRSGYKLLLKMLGPPNPRVRDNGIPIHSGREYGELVFQQR
jgi:hypothetical protein